MHKNKRYNSNLSLIISNTYVSLHHNRKEGSQVAANCYVRSSLPAKTSDCNESAATSDTRGLHLLTSSEKHRHAFAEETLLTSFSVIL